VVEPKIQYRNRHNLMRLETGSESHHLAGNAVTTCAHPAPSSKTNAHTSCWSGRCLTRIRNISSGVSLAWKRRATRGCEYRMGAAPREIWPGIGLRVGGVSLAASCL